MEQDKIVYQNKGFVITEHPRVRMYNNEIINEKDRIYRIKILGSYQPTIEDAGKLVYYLLKNKVYENKFYEYRDLIQDEIFRAEQDKNTNHSVKDEWRKKNGW